MYEVICIAWQDDHLPHKLWGLWCATKTILPDPRSNFVRWRLVYKMKLFWSNFTEDIFFASNAKTIQCLKYCLIQHDSEWTMWKEVQAQRIIKHTHFHAFFLWVHQESKFQLRISPHDQGFLDFQYQNDQLQWKKNDSDSNETQCLFYKLRSSYSI